MAAILKHWRESATLIIATSKVSKGVGINLMKAVSSDHSDKEQGKDSNPSIVDNGERIVNDFDILMMKRSSKSKFMPNFHVFPGGVAENSDFSSQWLSIFKKLGSDTQQHLFSKVSENSKEAPPIISRGRSVEFSSLPPDVAFRICAIREAFEESGVLLARPAALSKELVERNLPSASDSAENVPALNPAFIHDDPQVLETWRSRVNKEPSQFLEMCQQLDLVPEIWCLHEWANWLTPTHAKENGRRFDTIFYVCCVDHKPSAEQDHGETVSTLWASPSAILSAYAKQEGGVAPPQVYELTRLLHFSSAQELLSFVSRPGRTRVERFFPITASCQDHILSLLPGDALYPAQPNLTSVEKIHFNQSLEELSISHPRQNRLCLNLNQNIFTPGYTIEPRPGHAPPRMDLLSRIFKAKL